LYFAKQYIYNWTDVYEEEARRILYDNAIELGNDKKTVIMNALSRKI